MAHVQLNSLFIFHIIIPIGNLFHSICLFDLLRCSLFQQENMARVGSFSDNLMLLNNADSDIFQRNGIFAAFEDWECAKRFD